MKRILLLLTVALAAIGTTQLSAVDPPAGFRSLFNGKDLSGWKIPAGDNGHWKVVDGVIDYDARSEATGDKVLWSEEPFRDFVLRIDWRLKKEPGFRHKVAVILPNGDIKKDEDGKPVEVEIDDVDSGVYLRGSSKSQLNMWLWPIGSGEVWGYRTDAKMPAEVRAGVTPKKRADKAHGEWNTFEVTMKGERLSVDLNGVNVLENALLPGVPQEGPIGLQHHGRFDEKLKAWTVSPALVQFRNIFIKSL